MVRTYSVEFVGDPQHELNKNSIDAFVVFGNGDCYSITLFTPDGISEAMDALSSSGECAGGAYFWCLDPLILRVIDEEHLRKAVDDLLAEDLFDRVFSKCSDDTEKQVP